MLLFGLKLACNINIELKKKKKKNAIDFRPEMNQSIIFNYFDLKSIKNFQQNFAALFFLAFVCLLYVEVKKFFVDCRIDSQQLRCKYSCIFRIDSTKAKQQQQKPNSIDKQLFEKCHFNRLNSLWKCHEYVRSDSHPRRIKKKKVKCDKASEISATQINLKLIIVKSAFCWGMQERHVRVRDKVNENQWLPLFFFFFNSIAQTVYTAPHRTAPRVR